MSDNGNIQFIYASTATFGDGHIEMPSTQRVVFDIVRRSRANNPGWGVVGALLFGDGFFLQILEGEAQAVERLSAVIFDDERHRDPVVLRRRGIETPRFARWSMKFPTMSEETRSALGLGARGRFDPHALSDRKIDALIEHLLAHEESVV